MGPNASRMSRIPRRSTCRRPRKAETARRSTRRSRRRAVCGEERPPMMRLPRFRYFAPTSVKEALRIRAGEGPDAAFVAGGTDLYPNMKRRQQTPKSVIGLSRIGALRRLRSGEGGLSIGAAVPLSEIERHRRV